MVGDTVLYFGVELEVVWDGAADKQRTCFSLLPDYPRPSSLVEAIEDTDPPRGAVDRPVVRQTRTFLRARLESAAYRVTS